jgi:hypothetical protein
MYQQTGANTYAVVVYSLSNELMKPENGAIVQIVTNNNSDCVTIENMTVALPTGITASYEPLGISTGIQQIEGESVPVVYDLKGNRLNNGNGLEKGLYIVNGKKVVVK